ncbi:hypothetical protein AC629_36975 [Bradyrhizobium sp. NAS80.1]|nr:hypothetical protein AC629_36975 [Bradyrhizobium sp. NAS80.1]OKO80497.1 hypothetical protein AC630_15590 [Bradyrhizobium sp. AS23.2]
MLTTAALFGGLDDTAVPAIDEGQAALSPLASKQTGPLTVSIACERSAAAARTALNEPACFTACAEAWTAA